jgi:hypothetical protein
MKTIMGNFAFSSNSPDVASVSALVRTYTLAMGLTGDAADTPRPFDDSELETKANTEEGHLLFTSPLNS